MLSTFTAANEGELNDKGKGDGAEEVYEKILSCFLTSMCLCIFVHMYVRVYSCLYV